MRNHFIGSIVAVVVTFSPVILAQTAQQPAVSVPDLSGVWGRKGEVLIITYSKVPPPMTLWAKEKFQAVTDFVDGRARRRDDKDPILTHCAPPGVTRVYNSAPFEIIQIPGRVLMHFEWDHWVRQIWMDGREHPEDPDPTWMGHSIGRWDGDTLVVDTVGFNDKTWLDQAAHPHSDQLHLVERWRRVDQDILELQIMFDDPIAYPKPWAGKRLFGSKPNWEIQEEVYCEFRGILNSPDYLPFVP